MQARNACLTTPPVLTPGLGGPGGDRAEESADSPRQTLGIRHLGSLGPEFSVIRHH